METTRDTKLPAVDINHKHYYSFHFTEAVRNSSGVLLTQRMKKNWSLHSGIWRWIKRPPQGSLIRASGRLGMENHVSYSHLFHYFKTITLKVLNDFCFQSIVWDDFFTQTVIARVAMWQCEVSTLSMQLFPYNYTDWTTIPWKMNKLGKGLYIWLRMDCFIVSQPIRMSGEVVALWFTTSHSLKPQILGGIHRNLRCANEQANFRLKPHWYCTQNSGLDCV